METIKKIQWVNEDSWIATLAFLLPLWLLSVAIMAEGFPDPPISGELAITSFVLAIVTSIVLLWKGWLTVDVLLLSLFPFILVYIFDEISTGYKTPFILLCALILSAGIVGAQRSSSMTWRWLLLLFVFIVTWVLAFHTAQNYWQMVGNLKFGDCFPYTQDCPPLSGHEIPWWILFFSL